LEDVLEKIKKAGNYSVQLWYGEGMGCDDLDIPQDKREIKCLFAPVGYIGEVKVLWIGPLKDFLSFDIETADIIRLPNPPPDDFIRKPIPGVYAWGTDQSIKSWQEKHPCNLRWQEDK